MDGNNYHLPLYAVVPSTRCSVGLVNLSETRAQIAFFEEIVSLAHQSCKEQNEVLEPSIIINKYWIIAISAYCND